MSALLTINWRWDGDALTPFSARGRLDADKELVIGETYKLAVVENVSQASRGHYFASLKEVWRNLPENRAEQFPTPEHLRKYALIKCGYADSRQFVARTGAEARELQMFVRPSNDEYALILVDRCVVTIWTAQSQSERAMGKKAFNESKNAVLDYAQSLIGVTRKELEENAGRAA
ncbi:MAG: hypothetical protein WDN46_17500 [Methylocella sp.]